MISTYSVLLMRGWNAALFNDLLRNPPMGEVATSSWWSGPEHERQQKPNATRLTCLQNAISRWEQENR